MVSRPWTVLAYEESSIPKLIEEIKDLEDRLSATDDEIKAESLRDFDEKFGAAGKAMTEEQKLKEALLARVFPALPAQQRSPSDDPNLTPDERFKQRVDFYSGSGLTREQAERWARIEAAQRLT